MLSPTSPQHQEASPKTNSPQNMSGNRRTVRIARAAGGLVTVLAIVVICFGIQSSNSAQLARARELAAAAVSVQDEDPELAKMLAIQSITAAPAGSHASPVTLNSSISPMTGISRG